MNGAILRGLNISLPYILKECGVNLNDFLQKIPAICDTLQSPNEMHTSINQLKTQLEVLNRDLNDFEVLWRMLKHSK